MASNSQNPRRTFAIISHPDAGKTTLTEKLLLQGGAIHLAGEVKARGQARRARSDWMKIEQQRGISVTSSVMTFEREGIIFNLLDTPGHEDFSEDTYRTLTAVDSAIMVIDAAKGIDIFASEFNSSSVDFTVRWWAGSKPRDMWESRDAVIRAIKRGFDDAGIEIPFPYVTHTFKEPVPIKGPSND